MRVTGTRIGAVLGRFFAAGCVVLWLTDCTVQGASPKNPDQVDMPELYQTFALSFHGNGAVFAGGGVRKIDYIPLSLLRPEQIPEISRDGWEFIRWDRSPYGSGGALSANTMISADTEFYAIWNPKDVLISVDDEDELWAGRSEELIIHKSGRYRIELWGAQGGVAEDMAGGKGGYTKGEIYFNPRTRLYVYLGGARLSEENNSSAGSFNGGGAGMLRKNNGGGGGATDIRIIAPTLGLSDPSDDMRSLASRIMVAAGGGGANSAGGDGSAHPGGNAGGLIGGMGIGTTRPTGGGQTAGGKISASNGGANGLFGKGGSVTDQNTVQSAGGGGGGWYGGASGNHDMQNSSGAGGSSYISGHSGCVGLTTLNISSTPEAEAAASADSDLIQKSKSPTGYYFIRNSTEIIDGENLMPTPDGLSTETGHAGTGAFRIRFVK
jgi:hypothetical protein